MTIIKKTAISILLIGLCISIISIAGCSRKETSNNVTETEIIVTEDTGQLVYDFTDAYESEVERVENFVIRDEILVLYTGNSSNIVIPADLKIRGIQSAFAHSSVVSVVIPEQVEIIEGAFDNCYYLQSITVAPNNRNYTSVDGVLFNKAVTELVHFPQGKTGAYTIPSTITAIDWRFFHGCSKLTSLTIPASLTSMDGSFYSCTSLTSITVDQANRNFASADGVLFNKTMTELVWYPHGKTGSYTIPGTITSIKQSAFTDRTKLTSITIPNSVTSIGEYAFSGCTSLTSITIPNNITNIGENTFSGCTSLASITIPNSVTAIGANAFTGCTSLTSINIPGSVRSIGDSAFSGCARLNSINVNQDNVSYASADGVLFDKDITVLIHFPQGKTGSYTIPDAVNRVKDYALADRNGLTSIVIPASLMDIGRNAFFDCIGLTSITVDENNMIYASADGVLFDKEKNELIRFPRGKTGRYTIPDTVVIIGDNAFYGSPGLTSVTIPNSVTNIGYSAFASTGLTSLTIPNSVTSISYGAFANNPRLTIIGLPDDYYAYENGKGGEYFFDGCTELQQIVVSRNNKYYTTVDGVLFNKDKTVLIRFPQGKTGSYIIPNTVTSIAYKAFYNSSGLTSVYIPASVTSIGNFAFDGCTNLTLVNINNGVTDIGKYAFARCTSLASVYIPESVSNIGDFAFYNCTGLQRIAVDRNNINFILANGMLFRKDMIEHNIYLAAVR